MLIVVVNLDTVNTQSGWIELPLWEMGISENEPFIVRDLFSQDLDDGVMDVYRWTGRRNFVSLRPGSKQAHIFRVEKL